MERIKADRVLDDLDCTFVDSPREYSPDKKVLI